MIFHINILIYIIGQMQQKSSSVKNIPAESIVIKDILAVNPNPKGYKEIIAKITKTIQNRSYWYFTSDQAEFLTNVYDKQLEKELLKKRILQITAEKMDQVFFQIVNGTLHKDHETNQQNQADLQVKINASNLSSEFQFENNSRLYSPNHPRVQQNKMKIKQINEDYNKFKHKIDEMKKHHRERQIQKEIMEREIRESIDKQKKNQYHEEIKKKLENFKKKEEARKVANEKYKEFLKEFKSSKPLHVLMEEEYREKHELPAIEESRKKLQIFKAKKKPTLEEINEHERQYLEKKTDTVEKSYVQHRTIDVFKSHFYQSEQEKLREREEGEDNPIWDQLEKQKRYSQFVKEKIIPKISKKLRYSIEETKSQHNLQRESPDRNKIIEVGKGYLEYMRNLDKNRSVTPQNIEVVKESRHHNYMNYLEELKARHDTPKTSFDWERDLKDNRSSSKAEKREKILMKSKQLQEKAMRDEKLVSHYGYSRAEDIINKKKQIDETLLSSIKAKVAVLKDAKNQRDSQYVSIKNK